MDFRLKDVSFFDLCILSELSGHSSLRALARSLKIEPPALSKKLKQLQNVLAVEILRTSATGYSLTPDGIYISNKAKDFLLEANTLLPSKNSEKRSLQVFTVGTRGFLNVYLTDAFLAGIKETKSQHLLRFIDLSPEELRYTVFEGVLDIAISLEPFNWPKNWTVQEIGKLNWSFYVNRSHSLDGKVSKDELLKYPWTKSAYWNGSAIKQASDSVSISRQDRMSGHEIQTALVAIEVVKNSDNVALIPDIMATGPCEAGSIKRLFCPDVETPSAAVFMGVNADKINQKQYLIWLKNLRNKFKK